MFRCDASASRSRDASCVEKISDLFILKVIRISHCDDRICKKLAVSGIRVWE
jgi:hypothetical protein